MQCIVMLFFLFISFNSWAEVDHQQVGRSLANYQICSNVAISIDDKKMFNYYLQMLNDEKLSLLSYPQAQAQRVYLTWDKSETVLLKLDPVSLQKICLSRFDELSRKMQN